MGSAGEFSALFLHAYKSREVEVSPAASYQVALGNGEGTNSSWWRTDPSGIFFRERLAIPVPSLTVEW